MASLSRLDQLEWRLAALSAHNGPFGGVSDAPVIGVRPQSRTTLPGNLRQNSRARWMALLPSVVYYSPYPADYERAPCQSKKRGAAPEAVRPDAR